MHPDKVKLMDSGTVLFRAESLEEACSRVRTLLSEGTCSETAPGAVAAEFSDGLFFSIITAKTEACSTSGIFATSFQEGNRCRIPFFPFPSRKAVRRMERIKCLLGGE